MAGYMFKSPKGAIVFVVVTLLGVTMLVGTEENEGALLKLADDFEKHGEAMQSDRRIQYSDSAPIGFASKNSEPSEFASDEELIDDASGFDPTPELEPPLVSTEPQINLVESNAEIIVQ